MGESCGGGAYCLPSLVCADTDGVGAKCRQDCKTTNFLGCSNGAECIALNLPNDPQLGACHPKDGPPAVETPKVVETHMDVGTTTPDTGAGEDDFGRGGLDIGTTPTPPPPSTGSSGGGCRTTDHGNGTWLWVLIALLALRYRKRSMMIMSS